MREITPLGDAIVSSTAAPVALLFYFGLSEDVYRNTSTMPIEHEGNIYEPMGDLGQVESVEDSPGQIKNLRFTLDGVRADLLAVALNENIRNKPVRMNLAILSPSDYSLKDVVELWAGTFDQMPIRMQGSTMTIQATAEHRGATFSRPRSFRYTNTDQLAKYPGDTSMRFIPIQANHQDVWPSRAFFMI